MSRRRRDLTRLDLAGVHAVHFCFRAELSLNTGLRERLLAFSVDEDDRQAGRTMFGTPYRRSHTHHFAWGSVERLGDESGPHEVVFSYWAAPEEVPSVSLPHIVELIQQLEELPDETKFACHAEFKYPHETFASRWLALPGEVRKRDIVPFDEIRGYRLTRVSNGDIVYSIIVDRPTNEDIMHSITFSFLSRPASTLPSEIFKYAVSISSDFVRER